MCIGSFIHARTNSSMSGDYTLPFVSCIDIRVFCQPYSWPRLYSLLEIMGFNMHDEIVFRVASFTIINVPGNIIMEGTTKNHGKGYDSRCCCYVYVSNQGHVTLA